jgi:LPXTG-motif cell wall-anchored protein
MTRREKRATRRAGGAQGRVKTALLVLTAVLMAVPIVVASSILEPDRPAEALPVTSITIDLLADEARVLGGYVGVLRQQGDVHWRNRSGTTLAVTSPDGLLDSGPIPDGGSFHASLPVAGTYVWESAVGGGEIVVEADFTGQPNDRALDHIPDVAPPARDPDDIALHPDLAVPLPRSLAIVGFTETATVLEAQQALGSAWEIIGGLPDVGLVYAKLWSTSAPTSFAWLDTELGRLRANGAVEFASYDFLTVESVVSPPSRDAAETNWWWEPPPEFPVGAGFNWGLELARVPQAWNLLDGARDSGAQDRGATVVIDTGFEEHVDLDRLQILQLCTSTVVGAIDAGLPGLCTTLEPSDHGNHVAGIVGADFDDSGVTGIDPLSRLYGLPWQFESGAKPRVAGLDARIPVVLSLLLRQIRSGALTDVNVVNLSVQMSPPGAEAWWDARSGDSCGPGAGDDAGATGICYPDSYDPLIRENAEYGKAARRIFRAFAIVLDDPPLFVNSTGNSSDTYCPQKSLTCEPGTAVPQRAEVLSAESWANVHWESTTLPNPILSVESIGNLVPSPTDPTVLNLSPGVDRTGLSNIGGDLSTSGLTISTESSAKSGETGQCRGVVGRDQYCLQTGTSQAAPAVAGIAGLLAGWDPGLGAAELKQRLITWAVADTTDGAKPRVDAFAALLSMNGAARALVDVNDPSEDGNRRVIYAADGTRTTDVVSATEPGYMTDPDGEIDLRDFRRFRDAWLLRCQIDPEAGCPNLASIALDGLGDHPKRDLNGDGCVLLEVPGTKQVCPSELTFPRFDFNGDGTISRNASVLVPLRADGSPAPGPSDAKPMTDLEVLASQWEPEAPGALGWEAHELAGLLNSGDLTLVPDGLAALGATSATVTLVDVAAGTTLDTYTLVVDGSSHPVITVPAGRQYTLEVEAVGTPSTCAITVGPVSVRPGQDRRVDLDVSLGVVVDPAQLAPGESALVAVSAASCSGVVEGVVAEISLSPAVPGGADIPVTIVEIGADGTGTGSVDAGDVRGRYQLTATADVPVSATMTRSMSATTSFTVGEFYELELAASDGDTSGYLILDEFFAPGVPVGPSINGSGEVGFGAWIVNGDRYGIYVAQPGDDPGLPGVADQVSGDVIPVDGQVTGEPELNDAGSIVFNTVWSDGTDTTTGVHRADGGVLVTTLATGMSTFGTTTEPYSEVDRPTISENGQVIFVATDQAGDQRLAERQGASIVVGAETLGARPQLADDGTLVVQATVSRDCASYPGVCPPGINVILDPIIIVGPDVQQTGVVIAEGRVDGFGALSEPDISPAGDVITFVGDRNDQAGLFVSVRRADGSWQAPVAVAGPAAGAGDLVALARDRPTVAQIAGGPAGPVGDRILVTVKGTDSGVSAPAAEGVFVVPIDLVATSDITTPFQPVVDRPRLVAQIGDLVDGHTINRVELSDSIAAASTPRFADDHWVAFYAEASDGTNLHIRARALAQPEVPAGLVAIRARRGARAVAAVEPTISPTVGQSVYEVEPDGVVQQSLLAAPQQAALSPAFVSGPHVAAVTVDDDNPTAREPSRIVNRSRALDGTAAWAVADRPDVFVNPELISPDGELLVTYPNAGVERLNLGAPLSSGEFANEVFFEVRVEKGVNRPPIGEIAVDPGIVAPGQSVRLGASGVDPDGDRLSYSWDLDGDGTFGDRTVPAMVLTGAEIESLICGGTCVLEQPYPVFVEVLDERGMSVVVESRVVVSGLSEILVRLDPGLVQANPGSTAGTYLFIDKPAGDPAVPVQLSIDGAPDGWSISIPSEIDSGEVTPITVRVPSDALDGSFSFDVVATIGDVEHRATLTVVTLFGLIPECTTTVQGTVTGESGDPIDRANVAILGRIGGTGTTASDGTFTIETVLPQGATIERFYWDVIGPANQDFVFLRDGPLYARCDEVTEFNPVLRKVVLSSGITGRAVVGIENPVEPTRPLATDEPIGEATFTIRFTPDRISVTRDANTAPDGRATFPAVPIETTGGRSLSYSVTASKIGYWSLSRIIRMSSLDELQLVDAGDFPLIAACSGTVTGGRVIDQYGDPVAGASVWLTTNNKVVSDAEGVFTLNQESFLGTFNRPRSVTVAAQAPQEWGNNDRDAASAMLGSCGASTEAVTLELERPEPEVDYYGTVVGTVTDAETGGPLEGVRVEGWGIDVRTDANGNWSGEVLVGTNPDASATRGFSFEVATHWDESGTAAIPANGEVRLDTTMTARKYVTLTGTVTDPETGGPVEGALVISSIGDNLGVVTDFSNADGTYELPGLLLSDGRLTGEVNGPRLSGASSRFDFAGGPIPAPYWSTSVATTLVPEGPNVLDLQMVRVCESASVSGLVVNAATLEPLEGVAIQAGGPVTTTDAQGRYQITDIKPGHDNAPLDLTVFARKTGFFDASVDITTFCGANLIVDFGTPFGGFGTVSGKVTNSDNGAAIPDVFIGSNWGDSTTTAADGTYAFDRAPLTSDGGARDWTISAADGFQRDSQVVNVSAGADAIADFAFGTVDQPPTANPQSLDIDDVTDLPITLTGNDPEGVGLTFAIVDQPTGGSLFGTAPILTYTPSAIGLDSFTFTVSDGVNTSEPATVAIDVTAHVNAAPVITAPTVIEVIAGTSREIEISASDDNDDQLSFSLVDDAGGRAGLNDRGDGTGVVTFTAALVDVGSVIDVEVSVSDTMAQDSATMEFTVVAGDQPVNRSPEVSITAPGVVDEGTTVTFDATGTTDPDGDALTFAWTLVDFDLRTVAIGTGPVWTHRFNDDFVGAARLLVTDARGETAPAESDILVNNVPPEVQVSIGSQQTLVVESLNGSVRLTEAASSDLGDEVVVSGSFTDAGVDDSHEVLVDWGDGNVEAVTHTARSFGARHIYVQTGTFVLRVEVCDDDEGCTSSGDQIAVADTAVSPATPTTTPPATPTSTPPTTTPPSPSDQLPSTGSDSNNPLRLALALLLLGGALVVLGRGSRRQPWR